MNLSFLIVGEHLPQKHIIVMYLNGGRWAIQTPDGQVSPSTRYEHPIIFNGFAALSPFWGHSAVAWELKDAVAVEVDQTLYGKPLETYKASQI